MPSTQVLRPPVGTGDKGKLYAGALSPDGLIAADLSIVENPSVAVDPSVAANLSIVEDPSVAADPRFVGDPACSLMGKIAFCLNISAKISGLH
jgi:hypothetical protein